MCLRRQRRRIHVDRGHSAAAATTALFADLSGGLVDLITDVFQLIERFYRYVIRHRPTATFFVALNSDGQLKAIRVSAEENTRSHRSSHAQRRDYQAMGPDLTCTQPPSHQPSESCPIACVSDWVEGGPPLSTPFRRSAPSES